MKKHVAEASEVAQKKYQDRDEATYQFVTGSRLRICPISNCCVPNHVLASEVEVTGSTSWIASCQLRWLQTVAHTLGSA